MKTIGLLGGMSWESTVPYYRQINLEKEGRLRPLPAADLLAQDDADPDLGQAGRRIVVSALMREKGNVSAAARVLGISRATLYRRIRHLGLDKDLGRAIVSDLKQTRR